MKADDPHIGEVVAALAENQSELYGYIFLRLGSDTDAKDVLQETNLYLWKNIIHLDSPEHLLPWAKTLAAFALGLVLFIVTLLLNIAALRIVKRYRESYE